MDYGTGTGFFTMKRAGKNFRRGILLMGCWTTKWARSLGRKKV
jgi:hypothetical protein